MIRIEFGGFRAVFGMIWMHTCCDYVRHPEMPQEHYTAKNLST